MIDDTTALVERLREPRLGIHEDSTEELKTWQQLFDQCRAAADTIERLERDRAALAERCENMRSTISEFLTKYDQLEPALNNAFMMQQIHGMAYKGDNWSVELEALRKAVSTNPTPMIKDSPFNLGDVNAELKKACEKFPEWPTDPLHALAVLGEEFGELTKAVLQMTYEPHKTTPEEVRMEAVQTAAMAIRFVESLNRYIYKGCEQHKQTAAERIHNE